MGLPVKNRKKYVSHLKRWDKQTIVDEAKLCEDYALKNKKEIRKVEFMVSKLKGLAKALNTSADASSGEEAVNFISKLKEKGFISADSDNLDNVLNIKLRNVLERRLSNIVYKHKLARTPSQARQFIVHGHITVGGQLVTSPSYLVSLREESTIAFKGSSQLSDENHPERNLAMQVGIKDVEAAEQGDEGLSEKKAKMLDDIEAAVDEEDADETEDN